MATTDFEPSYTLGVVGGSGLYDIEGLEDVRTVDVETPFGSPSDSLTVGRLGDVRLVFVPRHGRGHRMSPSEVPYRANIYALRKMGAEAVLSVSAVGSLQEELAPGDIAVPDQLLDRTRGSRASTFFEGGLVAHVQFGEPYCSGLRTAVLDAAREQETVVHDGGTLVCMEGPQFSTKAESNLYRSWGASLIGMTALPEAKLAREAELCYATLALVTDYDCWHDAEEDVSVDAVLAVMKKNTATARNIVRRVAETLQLDTDCPCRSALRDGLMTAPEKVGAETRERLALFIERYGF